MKEVYKTNNKGKSGIIAGDGLCFGHSVHWSILMHKVAPNKTNPELNADRINKSKAIHRAMETKMVALEEAKVSQIAKADACLPRSRGAYVAAMNVHYELSKKETFNTYIQQAAAGFKFKLKSYPALQCNKMIVKFLEYPQLQTFVVDIGGHWVAVFQHKTGAIYFDPNYGMYEFKDKRKFMQHYLDKMKMYSQLFPDHFKIVQTPYLVTVN